MCDTLNDNFTVLKTPPMHEHFNSDDIDDDIPSDVAALLSLAVEEDTEYGVEPVTVEVIVSGGTLVDVLLNDKSVGYFAMRALCNHLCTELYLPDIAFKGSFEEAQSYLLRSDAVYHIIPTFGDAA